jgi:hypothetical protein
MTQVSEPMPAQTSEETDLVAVVQQVLAASDEPLTLPKIRAQLPARLRTESLEELGEVLRRQVAANVLYQYPKYRSQQDRFWDRPMLVHIANLVRSALQEAGPLAWSELRRKLPAYAVPQAESVVREQVGQGTLHQLPPAGKRGGERFGLEPADPKEFLRGELGDVFRRLTRLGFTVAQLREGALELLHEEEWSVTPVEEPQRAESTSSHGFAPREEDRPNQQPATP